MSTSVKTIVIADDDEDLRLLVQVTLEHPSYRILSAADGAQALVTIQQCQPDLLILDWMMPELTGSEVVNHLRQDSATSLIPVIMLTARSGHEDREQMASLALAGYLVKPFSPLELINTVNAVLAE